MHVHISYKHGSNPQITIDTSPKLGKIPLFKHGLGVDFQGEAWGANKASIEIACIPHARVSEFLEGEQGNVKTPMEWNIHKKLALQKDIKNPLIKNH